MIDELLASLSVMHILCIIHQYLIKFKDDYELQFTRFFLVSGQTTLYAKISCIGISQT